MDPLVHPDPARPDPEPAADDPPAAARPPDAVDRRGFVRSIASDSVTAAGMLAGVTGALTGSLMAAAKAGGASLAALGGSAPSPVPIARPMMPLPAAPAPVPAGPLTLNDADRVVIERLWAGILATSQPGAAPPVGIVRFVWDGTVFRIPGRDATARTTNLQRLPFASLTLIDPATGDALLISGRARLVHGAEGRDGAAEVLTACGVALPDGWDRADARGAPILVVLEPQRCYRRSPAEERP